MVVAVAMVMRVTGPMTMTVGVPAVRPYKFKDGHTLLYSLPIIANHSLPIDLALSNHRIL